MTDTLTAPMFGSPGSPLAILFDAADELRHVGEDEQREAAHTAVLDHIWSHYPDTLSKALDEEDWHGQPAVPDAGLEMSAVACLDGGWWLHHSTGLDDGTGDRGSLLTLIGLCTCGGGYVETVLDGEDDLLVLLTELRATGGFRHHPEEPDCTSIHRVRAWGVPRQ
ncbi:hypothetical protein GT030_30100 [Streptomyces sp. SID1328]|uniref:hypothetical protein n=1 Tax=Streptomyces sp. SID1328 TaxID=2690250 RepID=UPI001370952E|nr:hypothetical protein [Streptomyces sp. SID1328]MYV43004.1 hypothetical protein [Streptomyces sp. SID1328]